MELDWLTSRQMDEVWGMTERQVQSLCSKGKIDGVVRVGRSWLIKKRTQKPIDGRTKVAKEQKQQMKSEPIRK